MLLAILKSCAKRRSPTLRRGDPKLTCLYFLSIPSPSSERVTSSPTSKPPVSRVLFQRRPNSFLLISPLAEKPILVLPQGSFDGPTRFPIKSTSFVTFLIERFPFTV